MKGKNIKKYILVITATMLLYGCFNETPADNDEKEAVDVLQTESVSEEKKSISDVYEEITQNVELISPFCWDDEFVSNYYGIDVESLEEYVFSMSEDATSAETIIIMKANDSNKVSELSDCLQVVVDEKKNEMENYLPEQFDIVSKSSVQIKDNYVWLVISDNADTITKIIENAIS